VPHLREPGRQVSALPKLAPGFTYGAALRPAEIMLGDAVQCGSQLTGDVVRVGPKNVFVRSTVRWSPTGPWYTHVHKIPRHDVRFVFRASLVHPVQL
jgi:hypothetical protein